MNEIKVVGSGPSYCPFLFVDNLKNEGGKAKKRAFFDVIGKIGQNQGHNCYFILSLL